MRFTETRVEGGQVLGLPCSGPITSTFGATDIAAHANGHSGVDLGVAEGTPLYAPAAGRVLDVFLIGVGADDWERIFGNSVIVGDDEHVLLFAHLSQVTVAQGQAVAQGELLGYSGNTGLSTGPHLHWGLAPLANRYLQRQHPSSLLDPLAFCGGPPAPVVTPIVTPVVTPVTTPAHVAPRVDIEVVMGGVSLPLAPGQYDSAASTAERDVYTRPVSLGDFGAGQVVVSVWR